MFRTLRLVALAAIGAAALASAAAQQARPAGLAQAVAATRAADTDYAFDLTLESAKQNWRARYRPNSDPALTLLSPDRADLDRDGRRAFDNLAERIDGVSWCASEEIGRVEGLRLLREDEASATYAFQPTPESIRGEQARRFASRLRGELTLLKAEPDITRVRIFAPDAFTPMPLVRVDRIDIVIACAEAPNGRRYAATTRSHVRGSAFGQDFNEHSVQRAANLRAP